MKTCSIEGCGRKVLANGWCSRHYTRNRRYGSPYATRQREKGMTLGEVVAHLQAHTKQDGECRVLTAYRTELGYGRVGFNGRLEYAHVLVARYFLGDRPEGQQTIHTCERGADGCVSEKHLKYGTQEENQQRASAAGNGRPGGRERKLTEDDVRAIRAAVAAGETQSLVAKRFGVCQQNVSMIANRETYQWV